MDKTYRYCILYVQDTEIQRVMEVIGKYLPDGRGEVFYPRMEYYRRDNKAVNTRGIFQGYVFLYTDLNLEEVHGLLQLHRLEINSGMRELTLAGMRVSDPEALLHEDGEDGLYDLSDIAEDEKEFIDTLREGNGLLAMSSGYEVDEGLGRGKQNQKEKKARKKYVVMEGPLRFYQEQIVEVDKHNRRAFLKFEINGSRAQAGFNCLPKAHWFSNVDSRVVRFEDGTEADLAELKDKMIML